MSPSKDGIERQIFWSLNSMTWIERRYTRHVHSQRHTHWNNLFITKKNFSNRFIWHASRYLRKVCHKLWAFFTQMLFTAFLSGDFIDEPRLVSSAMLWGTKNVLNRLRIQAIGVLWPRMQAQEQKIEAVILVGNEGLEALGLPDAGTVCKKNEVKVCYRWKNADQWHYNSHVRFEKNGTIWCQSQQRTGITSGGKLEWNWWSIRQQQ